MFKCIYCPAQLSTRQLEKNVLGFCKDCKPFNVQELKCSKCSKGIHLYDHVHYRGFCQGCHPYRDQMKVCNVCGKMGETPLMYYRRGANFCSVSCIEQVGFHHPKPKRPAMPRDKIQGIVVNRYKRLTASSTALEMAKYTELEFDEKEDQAMIEIEKLRDEMFQDFQTKAPEVFKYLHMLQRTKMAWTRDEYDLAKKEAAKSLAMPLEDKDMTFPTYEKWEADGNQKTVSEREERKVLLCQLIQETLAKHPMFYEPGLFDLLTSKDEKDFSTDDMMKYVQEPAKLNVHSFRYIGPEGFISEWSSVKDLPENMNWNRDSILHWAMRITACIKQGCQYNYLNRLVRPLEKHWPDKRYKQMLVGLLFCQQMLNLIGRDTWIITPLQKAFDIQPDWHGVNDFEEELMKLFQ